ncbi:MAG: glycosyltransferase [Flavobacteriales bacterium]|nr:glycosyltransferase [Flavobacteriales bacterium]
MTDRVKLFLGAYINSANAQNLNCLALSKHLNKSKFEITTLSLYSEPTVSMDGVRVYRCIWPHRIFVYWAYFWNILKADVVYLPKAELLGFNSFLCQLLGKKSFSTIEGVLDETATQSMTSKGGKHFVKFHHRLSKRYSITRFMREYNYNNHNLETDKQILYLGTESDQFRISNKSKRELQNIIMIGNDLVRKGIEDFFEIAKIYTQLNFHIVGSGNEKINVNNEIQNRKLDNIVYHGSITQSEISTLLKNMQLLLFPSRSEGFPKVILETACAGVPSLVYSDYGASEWITDGQNGFVVDTLEEMKNVIKEIQKNEDLLDQVSKNAVQLGLSYDWQIKVNDWEDVIISLYTNKKV